MVHPGLSGCEVYFPLAKRLSENFSCIGIENYNLHHYEKIQSLQNLTNKYLNSIEINFKMNEDVHLLGWSLGGYFVLKWQDNLKKGFNKVYVYLLDSFNYSLTILK